MEKSKILWDLLSTGRLGYAMLQKKIKHLGFRSGERWKDLRFYTRKARDNEWGGWKTAGSSLEHREKCRRVAGPLVDISNQDAKPWTWITEEGNCLRGWSDAKGKKPSGNALWDPPWNLKSRKTRVSLSLWHYGEHRWLTGRKKEGETGWGFTGSETPSEIWQAVAGALGTTAWGCCWVVSPGVEHQKNLKDPPERACLPPRFWFQM